MHTLVSAQPVESHPVFFLCPYQGCFPASESPTKPRSKCSQKPAELGSKVCKETFPIGMQMIHMRIPPHVSEFARRLRRAGHYHKCQESSSLRAPGGGEPRADAEEHRGVSHVRLVNTHGHGWPQLRAWPSQVQRCAHAVGLWERCGRSSCMDTKHHHQNIQASIWNKLRGSVSANKLHLRWGIPWSYSHVLLLQVSNEGCRVFSKQSLM